MTNEKRFIEWLQTDLTHFVALVEEGSAAAGDPWQKGFSDHDLTVVVRQDIDNEMDAVQKFLSQYPLGNTCLVGLRLSDSFASGDSLNDLSLKFRAKTIAGEDVVTTKAKPNRKKAATVGHDGLEYLLRRLERRWINLASWTNEYAQHKNYEIFKNFFVFCSAYYYGKTGHYPVTRAETAALIHDQTLAAKVLQVTNSIGSADKAAQQAALEAALTLIPEILA